MTRTPYDPHRQAEGVNRADRGLRTFAKIVIGDAVMCPQCDGGGYVVRPAVSVTARVARPAEPVTCPTCNGEGLDPHNLPRSD
jgi:hypothetical protein